MSSSTSSLALSSSGGANVPGQSMLVAHAALMCCAFVVLFPLAALAVRVPLSVRVTRLHAPWQLANLAVAVSGTGLGIALAKERHIPIGHTSHTIVGLVVVGCLLLVQPAMGWLQHQRSRKTARRSPFGWMHVFLGRVLLILGVINGGRGFSLAHDHQYKAYIVVVAVVGAFYMAVLVWNWLRSRRQLWTRKADKGEGEGKNQGVINSVE
jgi:threonine/homoserine/homoserine lactone efflux protein